MRKEAASAGRGFLFLESGDFLFPEEPLFPEEVEQRRVKAELIAAATKAMAIDFIAIGDQDLRLGVEFLKTVGEGLPLHCANLVQADGKPVFPGRAVKTVGDVKVGMFAVLLVNGPDGKPLFEDNPNFRLEDPFAAAAREVKALQAEGAQAIVAVTHLGVGDDMRLVNEVPGIHLVFGGHSQTMLSEPNKAPGGAFVLQSGSRGKYLGRLDLDLKGDLKGAFATLSDVSSTDRLRERIKHYESEVQALEARIAVEMEPDRKQMIKDQVDFYKEQLAIESKSLPAGSESASAMKNELVPLSRDIADEPKVAALVQGALDKIASMPPPPVLAAEDDSAKAPESSPYVGATVCQACHPTQWTQWRTTGHAKAYKTLVGENHALDFDCVGCHTTGYRKEGGPKDPFSVAGFTNVQCESCHGAGRAHAKEPKKVKLSKTFDEGLCRSCHSVEQTGDRFVFGEYLPKVAHPSPKTN